MELEQACDFALDCQQNTQGCKSQEEVEDAMKRAVDYMLETLTYQNVKVK